MSTFNRNQDNTPAQKQSDAVSATTTQESTQISISNASDTNSHSCISSTKPDPVSNFISTFITNIQNYTDNNAALQTEFLKVIQNFTFDKKITITEDRISALSFRDKMKDAVNSVNIRSDNYIVDVKNAIANAIAHRCGFKDAQDQDQGDFQLLDTTATSPVEKDTDVWFANKCLDLINEVIASFALVSDKTVNTNVTGDVTCTAASQTAKVSKADLKEIINGAISSALEAKNYDGYIVTLMDKIAKYFKREDYDAAVSADDKRVLDIKAAIDPVAEDSTKTLENMKNAVKEAIAKEKFTDYADISYVQSKAAAALAVETIVESLVLLGFDDLDSRNRAATQKGFPSYADVESILAKEPHLNSARNTIFDIETIIDGSATLFKTDIESKPDYLKKVIEIVKDAIADKMLDSKVGYAAVTKALGTNPKDAKAQAAEKAINDVTSKLALVAADWKSETTSALTKDYKVALEAFKNNWGGETLYITTAGACISDISIKPVTNDNLKEAIDKALTNLPNTPIDLTKYTFEDVTNIVPALEKAIQDVPTASQNYTQSVLIATKAVLDSEYVVVHKAKTALDYMMISSVNKVAVQNTLQMLANKFMAVADNTTTKLQAILSSTEQALKTFNVQQLFGPSQSASVTTENDCATEAECKITSITPLPHSYELQLHKNPSAYEYTLKTDDPNNKVPIEGNISTINCDYALFNGIYSYYGSNEIKILFRLNSALSDISPLTFDGLPSPTKENVYNYMKNAETQPILPTLKFHDGQIISTEKSYDIPENCLDGTAQTCAISDDTSTLKYVELRYTDYVMLSQDNNDPIQLTVKLFNHLGVSKKTIDNVRIKNMDTNYMITTGLKQDGNDVLWSLHSSKLLEEVSPFKGVSQTELTKEYINTMAAGSASYVITKNFLNTCFAQMQVAKVIYQQACNSDPRCAIDEIIPGVINNEALKDDQYIKFSMLAQDLYTLKLCTLSTKSCSDEMVGKFIHANEYFLLFVQNEKNENGILLKTKGEFNGEPNVKLGCKDAGLWENSLYDECWMAGYEKPNNYGLDLFTVDATKCNTFEL